jgi:probable HAF family extracellular repeat protein
MLPAIAGIAACGDPQLETVTNQNARVFEDTAIVGVSSCSYGYEIVDLGALPGVEHTGIYVNDINSAGMFVGYTWGIMSPDHAFLWSAPRGMIDLGHLPGDIGANAKGVNDSGVVVGSSGNHAFWWYQGSMHLLPGLTSARQGAANAINNHQQAVGYSYTGTSNHPVLWSSPYSIRDLGTLGGHHSEADDINDSGVIVGWSYLPVGNVAHPFLWQNGHFTDLGLMPGNSSCFANRINNNRVVVGRCTETKNAFRWQSGHFEVLPHSPWADEARPSGINDLNYVVGYEARFVEETRAVLWTPDRQLIELNKYLPPHSGWLLTHANDINNNLEIVGYGQHFGRQHVFLLRKCSRT